MQKKLNFILCIAVVVVVLFQMVVMSLDYFSYIDYPTDYERAKFNKTEQNAKVSLMEYMWTVWPESHDMPAQIKSKLAADKKLDAFNPVETLDVQFAKQSNDYVIGLVGTMVLGLVVLVMTIFTRKSLVQYLFTLAWAAVSVYGAFGDNFILNNYGAQPGAGRILLCLKIASIAAAVLVAARAYPWFHTRWIYKEKLDLEALNA